MARVLILIAGHLCNAPRPQKEAYTLARLGHDVTVAGCWTEAKLADRDGNIESKQDWKYRAVLDLREDCGWYRRLLARTKGKLARIVFKYLKISTPSLLGYEPTRFLAFAKEFSADLTIVHSESGLWVGCELIKSGYRVGVDFEDWFSEDLLPKDRKYRPIEWIKKMEGFLLKECQYSLTTSSVLSSALSHSYGTSAPQVVYNVFPWSDRIALDNKSLDRKDKSLPSLHWFSQTMGPGRGLETLCQALCQLRLPLEVHLRGNCSPEYRNRILGMLPKDWRQRLFFHVPVDNHELLSRISEHDIGLAIEENEVPSRDLTITNKFFQYMLGGLAVIATDTAGQREVFSSNHKIGLLISPSDPDALAGAIENLLKDANVLQEAKRNALKACQEGFCWEKQELVVSKLAQQIF